MKIALENINFFYINLDKRTDRNTRVVEHLSNKGINATRISASTGESTYKNLKFPDSYLPGNIGCYLSHYKLMDEYDRNSDKILGIFEDDVELCEDFNERIKYIESVFDKEWDIFFLSSFYHLNDDPKRWHEMGDYELTDMKYIHRTYGSFCTHAYLVNPKSIDKILGLMRETIQNSFAIDHAYILIQEFLNCYAFTPGTATQILDFSDIQESIKDQSQFETIVGPHYFANRLEDFDYNSFFNSRSLISSTIEKYIFVGPLSGRYSIYNYDYFTSKYRIPMNTEIDEMGEYRFLTDCIYHTVPKNKSIIDIGANCGMFSVPCSKMGYDVHCFEPITMNIRLLERNKKENQCDTMHIHQYAVSNKNHTDTIYIPYCSDNTSLNKDVAISNMDTKTFVEENINCITFDSWYSNNKLDIGFIKIDVQGYEQTVLEGMVDFLNSCNDIGIFLEWDPRHTSMAGNSLDTVKNILTHYGFVESKRWSTNGDKLFYKTSPVTVTTNFE